MDTLLLRLHQKQVEHQCRAGLMAFHGTQAALVSGNQEAFWASVQALLTAAANVSKSLWGQSGKLAAEREPLRRSLSIPEDSPLANTDLRNHLDHYDDRLDRWWQESTHHNHADFIIGPADRTLRGVAATDVFRHFDPGTGEVIFWGEHHSLTELGRSLAALLPRVAAEASRPPWDTEPPARPPALIPQADPTED